MREFFSSLGTRTFLVAALLAFALLSTQGSCRAEEPTNGKEADSESEDSAEQKLALPFDRRWDAPSLEGGKAWLNTSEPLTLAKLRGKFVILDFWTYCCINCMHVLPELKKLEKAYPNELVVIGVHSAKFEGEKETENIRDAILRYEIEHPVVNDDQMLIWRRFQVRSWPSLAFIDPEGKLVGIASGEHTFEQLDRLLKAALPYYRQQGSLSEEPIKFELERESLVPQPLLFPGKILADGPSNRLFVADSNHNRLVVSNLEGNVQTTIGTGQIGARDGDFQTATFDHPQGMALDGETLYVADTENHLLRKVDLKSQAVTTIAGVGEQARGPWPEQAGAFSKSPHERFLGAGKSTALNSPWALLLKDEMLYVAMAGPHQIWRMNLASQLIGPYAGNGREDIVDGPLLPEMRYQQGASSFAQPSGLATDGEWIYVADTEGSSIRAVPFDTSQEVKTIVGTSRLPGGRLFVFGDRDGTGLLELRGDTTSFRGDAEQTTGPLLQHAIGIAYGDGVLYVADTYNNKIKLIDVESQRVTTLAGSGEAGNQDGTSEEATFDEPAGLALAGDRLFIADTNNHRIRVIHLADNNRVSTLEFSGLDPPGSTPEDSQE